MNEVDLRNLTLNEVTAFHDQLLILDRAGLRFDPGMGDRNEPLAVRLDAISAALAVRVGHGQTLAQAIAEPGRLSPEYRMALETWCHSPGATEALEAILELAEQRRDMEEDVGYSLLQPLIVFSLVYLGFILLAMTIAPGLEAIYAQQAARPSMSLQFLILVRSWLPVWGPGIPIVVALAILGWKRRANTFEFSWLSGRDRSTDALRTANYAENLAKLVESGQSLPQAVELIGPPPRQMHESGTSQLLLQWAMGRDVMRPDAAAGMPSGLDTEARSFVLRFAAQVYRAAAQRQAERRRSWLPLALGTGLSGLLVLFYSMSLIAPVAALLKKISED